MPVAATWTRPPLHHCSEMLLTLFCFIPGGEDIFSIKIDDASTVDELKGKIRKKMAPELNPVALMLYKISVDINISDPGRYQKKIEEISRPDYVFTPKDFLHPIEMLKTVFGSSGPVENQKRIHVLVELPPGELINCCG